MLINSISDFRKAMRNGPYAWPGGYQCWLVTSDGACLSFEAAKAERRNILEALASNDKGSGWQVFRVECEANGDWPDGVYCDHTNVELVAPQEVTA